MPALTETLRTTEHATTGLDATDRCDYCGAQALVRVVLSTGTLDLCAHDHTANERALDVAGAVVLVDQRHQLSHR